MCSNSYCHSSTERENKSRNNLMKI
ncbi:CxxxxCH/CxxCH domain-containing protein [Oceanobacillus iheyensis]